MWIGFNRPTVVYLICFDVIYLCVYFNCYISFWQNRNLPSKPNVACQNIAKLRSDLQVIFMQIENSFCEKETAVIFFYAQPCLLCLKSLWLEVWLELALRYTTCIKWSQRGWWYNTFMTRAKGNRPNRLWLIRGVRLLRSHLFFAKHLLLGI